MALCLAIGVLLLHAAPGQRAENENADKNPRKLVYKVEPQYPAELKRAYIGGMVWLGVIISPRGTGQTVSIAGRNPAFGEGRGKAGKEMKNDPRLGQKSACVMSRSRVIRRKFRTEKFGLRAARLWCCSRLPRSLSRSPRFRPELSVCT